VLDKEVWSEYCFPVLMHFVGRVSILATIAPQVSDSRLEKPENVQRIHYQLYHFLVEFWSHLCCGDVGFLDTEQHISIFNVCDYTGAPNSMCSAKILDFIPDPIFM